MRLGEMLQIRISTPDLAAAVTFYSLLGFQRLERGDKPAPWQRLTDGSNLILLVQNGRRQVGAQYATTAVAARRALLEKNGMQVEELQIDEGEIAVVTAVDGLLIVLFNQEHAELPEPPGDAVTLCGTFGELALCTGDFDRAAAFWTAVGYRQLHAANEPYPWGIFSDDLLVLGLHQMPAEEAAAFAGPTLTYFAPDMPDRLAAIRAAGLTFVKEFPNAQGVVSGAALEAPGCEQILLFQGDV